MQARVVKHPVLGECLLAGDGLVEVGIPLEFGIRIGHFALAGGRNVFFEQPPDMTDLSTGEGWRVRGGHRLWIAPEGPRDYHPDNDPVEYAVEGDRITVVQREDPRLRVIKRVTLRFLGDARVEVTHEAQNTGETGMRCSLWAISSMAPGGIQRLSFQQRSGGYDPWHHFSTWDYTSLGDPRVRYSLDGITLEHRPLEARYKIGVGHPFGPVTYENGDVTFALHWDVEPSAEYPDGGVSYETFMCRHMVELETLSPLGSLPPGGRMTHREIWELRQRR